MTNRFVPGKLALPICLALGLIAGPALAQDSLDIVSQSSASSAVTMNVNMTNSGPVQGYVLAISYDNSLNEVTAVDAAGAATAAGAELVVGEIFHALGGFTLGCVLDATSPFAGQAIAAGAGQLIATFDVSVTVAVAVATPCPFSFVDATFNDPPLSNIIVIAGLSIGVGQGLGLNDGVLTCLPPPPVSFEIQNTTIASESLPCDGIADCGPVNILMDNTQGVQGFVLAIQHDSGSVSLSSIDRAGVTTSAAFAEFFIANLTPAGGPGGTLGVVLDFGAPFGGQTIAPGTDQVIAQFVYCCNSIIPAGGASDTSDLTFVDGVLGSPALSNVAVVGGLSINPALTNGTITCTASPVCPSGATVFSVGCPLSGVPGATVDVCFFYQSPSNIQGFQLAVCFDCCLTFGTFSIAGSIADAVGAEFVNYNVDNDPLDGDGCEFVAGILLDALPPFAGQTVPSTATPLLIGCIDATICDDAPCGECLFVEFCNGADGAGSVPIENIVVVDFQSVQDISFVNCCVFIEAVPTFKRGDCNDDDKVDLADAAAVLGHQFAGFPINCEDACDANDDGKINLADSVYLLNYLFKFGPPPPNPGPTTDGPDPTDDTLDCETGAC